MARDELKNQSLRTSGDIPASSLAGFLEWYDLALIAYFADCLASQLIPPSWGENRLWLFYAVFAGCAVWRLLPVYAGRRLTGPLSGKSGWILCLCVGGGATLLTALIPAVKDAGWGAMAAFVVVRILQSLAYGYASLYTWSEHTGADTPTLSHEESIRPLLSCMMGKVAGTLVGTCLFSSGTIVDIERLYWRFGFAAVILPLVIAVILSARSSSANDSSFFSASQAGPRPDLGTVIRGTWKYSILMVTLFCLTFQVNIYVLKESGILTSYSANANTVAIIFLLVSILLGARLADQGRARGLLSFSLVSFTFLVLPFYSFIHPGMSLPTLFLLQGLFAVAIAGLHVVLGNQLARVARDHPQAGAWISSLTLILAGVTMPLVSLSCSTYFSERLVFPVLLFLYAVTYLVTTWRRNVRES